MDDQSTAFEDRSTLKWSLFDSLAVAQCNPTRPSSETASNDTRSMGSTATWTMPCGTRFLHTACAPLEGTLYITWKMVVAPDPSSGIITR